MALRAGAPHTRPLLPQAWLHKQDGSEEEKAEAPCSPIAEPTIGDPGTPTEALPTAPPPTATRQRRRRLHTSSEPSSAAYTDDESDGGLTAPFSLDITAATQHSVSSPSCGGRETPTWLKSAECLLHSASSHAPEELVTAAAGRTAAPTLHGQRLAAMHAAMAVLERTQADAVESKKDELRGRQLEVASQ